MKKIQGKKVSGSSTDELRNVFIFELAWSLCAAWKTSSNYVINIDTDNENQEDGDDERPDTPSDMSSSSVKESSLNR